MSVVNITALSDGQVNVLADSTVVDSGTCGDNLRWTLDSNGTLTISGTGAMENYKNRPYYECYANCPWFRYRNKIMLCVIEDGVTTIGNFAFYCCRGLRSITIPKSVTTIGRDAFYGCNNLISITIPENITEIGDYAFRGCSSLTSITIPKSVMEIGWESFMYCSSLSKISVDAANSAYCSVDGVLYTKDMQSLVAYPPAKADKVFNIPNGVTEIGGSAFFCCSSLTSITIPEGVTEIGYSAFYGCSNLASITIPESVTTISQCVFKNCYNLKNIKIDNEDKDDMFCYYDRYYKVSSSEDGSMLFRCDNCGDEIHYSVPESIGDPETEPITDSVTDSITEPITESVTEPVTEPLLIKPEI